jgi:hypothetical protein
MNFGFFEQTWPMVEVSEYHLIFDLNGVLLVTGEGQIKSRPIVLKPNFKKFLFICVKKFIMYIWSLTMKRNVLKHLDIIIKKIGIFILISKILD